MKQSSNNFLMPLLDSNINRCKTILEKSTQNISLLILTYNINIDEISWSVIYVYCVVLLQLNNHLTSWFKTWYIPQDTGGKKNACNNNEKKRGPSVVYFMGLLYYEVTIILHNKLLRQYFRVEWIMSLFSTIVHSELYYTCIFCQLTKPSGSNWVGSIL